jgi:DNA-binding CsgD family transcriptional regulator
MSFSLKSGNADLTFCSSKDTKPRLTRREEEILIRIASGSTNDKIFKELFISLQTIKTHIYNIYRKIDSPKRIHAAVRASKNL